MIYWINMISWINKCILNSYYDDLQENSYGFKFEHNFTLLFSSIIFNLIIYFAQSQNIILILSINNTYYTPFNKYIYIY